MKEFVNKLIDWIRKWKSEFSCNKTCNKNCNFCRFSNDCFDYKEGKVDTD